MLLFLEKVNIIIFCRFHMNLFKEWKFRFTLFILKNLTLLVADTVKLNLIELTT